MLHSLISIWTELAPWLLLGAAVAGLLHVLLPPDFVRGHLRGVSGVFKAVGIGVPLPLCSCAVIPAGLGLKKQGASDGATVGFLVSTPQTGVDSVLVTAGFLGWPFAVFKVLVALVTGVVAGLWAGDTREELVAAPQAAGVARPRRTWRDGVDHFVEVLQPIYRWLIAGVLISVAIETLLPPDAFAGLAEGGTLLAMLGALLVGLPLYICATASVPVAAALVGAGFPPGAAIVFLIAGPASNVATIGAIYRVLGRRVLFIYLTTVTLGSILGGLLFQDLIAAGPGISAPHVHGPGVVASLAGVALAALVSWFAFKDVARWWRGRSLNAAGAARGVSAPAPHGAQGGRSDAENLLQIDVAGLTCSGCVRKLETALLADERIQKADVCLTPGRATIVGAIGRQQAEELIRRTGFAPGPAVSSAPVHD